MDEEKYHRQIHASRSATLAKDFITEILVKRKRAAVAHLIATFREGKTDIGAYLANVAALSVIEDIEVTVDKTITKGNKAYMEAQNGTETDTE